MLPRTPQKVICIVSIAPRRAAALRLPSVPRGREERYSLSSCTTPPNGRRTASRAPSALVVLGCGVAVDGRGGSPGALARRVAAAARGLCAPRGPGRRRRRERRARVGGGGRGRRDGARARRLGVPERAIVRERCSLSTRDNARFSAEALARRGHRARRRVVTCDWHLPRAARAVRAEGVEVEGLPAASVTGAVGAPRVAVGAGAGRWALRRDAGVDGARRVGRRAPGARRPARRRGPAARPRRRRLRRPRRRPAPSRAPRIMRRARDVPARAPARPRPRRPPPRRARARAHPRCRRRAAPARPRRRRRRGRRLGAPTAWASRAAATRTRTCAPLAARLASLEPARPLGGAAVDARVALLRALGRCGGDVAEQTLRAWLRRADAAPPTLEAAAFALGDVASRRGSLSLESASAPCSTRRSGRRRSTRRSTRSAAPTRARERISRRACSPRRARRSARPGPARFFAVRALGARGARRGVGPRARAGLARTSRRPSAPRPRAARPSAQGRVRRGSPRRSPPSCRTSADALAGDLFGVLRVAAEAIGDDLPKKGESALWALARLEPGRGARRRRSRGAPRSCAAPRRRSSRAGAWDSDVLRGCDVADGEAGEAARLVALERGRAHPVAARRRGSSSRGASTRACARQPSTPSPATPSSATRRCPVLAEALASTAAGVVATAADVVHAHPERATSWPPASAAPRSTRTRRPPPPTRRASSTLASRRRCARPPSPTRGARTSSRRAPRCSTRRSPCTLDEARAVRPGGVPRPQRHRARARGQGARRRRRQGRRLPPARRAGRRSARGGGRRSGAPTRVVFETDAGTLGVPLRSRAAPVAATRFVALARSGFYTGVVVHRVVPGFVAQLGDRGGDGYGGSGDSLRCETSPVPFRALDVGVALAGRDTGLEPDLRHPGPPPAPRRRVRLGGPGRRGLERGRRRGRGARRPRGALIHLDGGALQWRHELRLAQSGRRHHRGERRHRCGARQASSGAAGASVALVARRAAASSSRSPPPRAARPCRRGGRHRAAPTSSRAASDAPRPLRPRRRLGEQRRPRHLAQRPRAHRRRRRRHDPRQRQVGALRHAGHRPALRASARAGTWSTSRRCSAACPFASFRSAYSAAKHALCSLTENLRMELAADIPEVRVTCVYPGVVYTDFGKNALGGGADSRTIPGGRPPSRSPRSSPAPSRPARRRRVLAARGRRARAPVLPRPRAGA